MEEQLEEVCNRLREDLLDVEKQVRVMRTGMTGRAAHDLAECIAQATLALRHVEDARMRLGKVIQHATNGVSIYDT